MKVMDGIRKAGIMPAYHIRKNREVNEMDIVKEAFEAHSIEQEDRKGKYQSLFEQDMKMKFSQWEMVNEKVKGGQKLTDSELSLLIGEIAYLYDSSASEAVPYLQGHMKRMKQKHVDSHAIEIFVEVIRTYFDAMSFIMEKELGIFGRKKVIDSGIEKAKEVIKETEEKANILTLFIKGELNFMEEWEKDKRKWEIADHQQLINRSFLPKEIDWMLNLSRVSIEEQVTSGKLFFSHHFDRVEKEQNDRKRIENFKKVFMLFQKAFETIATEPIPMLDTGGHLERMKDHLRHARNESDSAYHEVKGFIYKK